MIVNILWLIGSLVLILVGANALTDGASAIARRSGISELVVGLTIVAFGTSTPELVIAIMSAAQGSTEIAVGSVVGSNIFNILVIIGMTALIKPIAVERSVMTNEIPMTILSAVALWAIGSSVLLGGSAPAEISRAEGILLLLFFAIFLRYTFGQAKKTRQLGDPEPSGISHPKSEESMGMTKAVIWVIGGLAMLIWGGDRFVDSASAVAAALGMSEAMIGLTIVAIGTSLPELAASVAAAIKGQPGLAVGNVIGSNIFNIFLVAGLGAVVRPLQFGGIGQIDLIVMTVACLLFWLFGQVIKTRTITRGEGAILLACYVGYTLWLIMSH